MSRKGGNDILFSSYLSDIFMIFYPCDIIFQPHVTLKITPYDIHSHMIFYGGDAQFIFCTPVNSYFGLSVLLWHAFLIHVTGVTTCLFWTPVIILLVIDPCGSPLLAYFYPCDKYVAPPARREWESTMRCTPNLVSIWHFSIFQKKKKSNILFSFFIFLFVFFIYDLETSMFTSFQVTQSFS